MITFGMWMGMVFPRTSALVYGAGVELEHVQMMGVTGRTLSAEGTGNDRIVVVASRKIAGSSQVRMQGVPLDALAVITGEPLVESGAAETLIRTFRYREGRYPWFGMVGQGLEEEGNGDVLIYVPKCKIAGDINFGSLEYGVLSSIEFPVTCLGEGDYDIFDIQHRATMDDDVPFPIVLS